MADKADKVIGVILTIVIVFLIVGNLAATLVTSTANITSYTNVTGTLTRLPLAGLFASTGIVFIIFMFFVLKTIMKQAKG